MEGYILLFLASACILAFVGKYTVDALSRIAYYSHWREFIVAFFTISLGAVAPEFFIGVISALRGVSELSFGNIVGQNIILMTLTIALSVLVLKGSMPIESKTVKASATYASLAAILPFILVLDGSLSRIDGVILIISFILFVAWLFGKEDRFSKIFGGVVESPPVRRRSETIRDFAIVIVGLAFVVLSAEGLIKSALGFTSLLGLSYSFVGILVVAAGTGFPETYFSLRLAKQGNSWMILGGLMGSIAISSTLVLGIVSIIQPIVISDISLIAVGRVFLIIAALLFLYFMRTKNKITHIEAFIMGTVYVVFFFSSIILHLVG
jgi:cation:H+ antiporter